MLEITEFSAIQPAKAGLKLMGGQTSTTMMVARDLLALPFNVYLLDRDSRLLLGNERLAHNLQLDSIHKFKGCSVKDYLPRKSEAKKVMAHDRQILANLQQQFFEETYFAPSEEIISYLTVKMPLINENDQVIGVLGCSTLIDQGAKQLIPFLNTLIAANLLQSNTSHLMMPLHPQLTPREQQISKLTQRGYTAKHIGRLLGLSNRTVEGHLLKIKIKLGVTSRNELIDKLTDLSRS